MKPSILIFTRYYLPGYRAGGPIRSVANLVDLLCGDFEFHIVTADRDVGAQQSYEGIRTNAWNSIGNARVFYASPAARTLVAFISLIRKTPHNALYLNSFFDPIFTLQPLLARRLGWISRQPLVIAPRGEFSPEALRIKGWKKKPYLKVARWLDLYSGIVWQASNETEAQDLKRAFERDVLSSARLVRLLARNISSLQSSVSTSGEKASKSSGPMILVAPDIAATSFHESTGNKATYHVGTKPLQICFLSRIAPMKNLDYALRVLSRVKVPIQFNIYGPIEQNSYWSECKSAMGTLPSNVRAVYCGSVDHASVRETIAQHDLFFLPTRGENFGHVIVEALSAGTPVLISDRTPWKNVENVGAGWALTLENELGFVRAIEEAALWSAEKQRAVRSAAMAFAESALTDPSVIGANRELFMAAIRLSGDVNRRLVT